LPRLRSIAREGARAASRNHPEISTAVPAAITARKIRC
jgi:hypothetical protein